MAATSYKDRISETSTFTGSGTVALLGAINGFAGFTRFSANQSGIPVMIEAVDVSNQPTGEWEVALCTLSTDRRTLTRNTVRDSSNAGATVSFGAGTKRVTVVNDGMSIENTALLAGGNAFTGNQVVTGQVSVTDEAYAPAWNSKLEVPTKNAVYDKIEAVVATIPAAPSTVIDDTPYAASWNGVTTIAPSKNAVYDQIELKVSKAGDTMTGALTVSYVNAAILLNPTTGSSFLSLRGTDGAADGIRMQATGATGFMDCDTFSFRNRAGSGTRAVFSSTGLAVTANVTVVDDAYAVGWNGSLQVPTKNAVYDKIEAIIATIPTAGNYVDQAGDTMTGMLSIGLSTAPQLRLLGGGPAIRFRDLADTTTYGEFFINSAGSGIRAGTNGLSVMSVDGLTTYYQMAATLFSINANTIVAAGKTLSVPDDPYAAGWDGKTEVPTKNAVYDKMETKADASAMTTADALRVLKAGDTMTGNLTLAGTGDANRKLAWGGAGGNIYINASGAAAYGATDHNWTDIAGTGIFGSLGPLGLYFNGNLNGTGNAHVLGKNVGAATDNSLLLRNTLTYNTISMVSYATDGSAGSTDGYIQSVRAGPMAISGGTGLEFRVFNTPQMWMNSFGLIVSGAVHAKASVPATNGWAGITCGNTTNSGYLEVYGPNQVRAAYIGYADTSAVYIVCETGRSMVTTAAAHGWRRASDNLEIMSLAANGALETYTITAKGSTGSLVTANAVQSIEARASAADQGAWMAFHSPGARAMFIGLDADNQFKIGGWGWTGAKFRFMDTGVMFLAGNALQMESTGQCEVQCGPNATHGIMYMSNANAGWYKTGGAHTYQEMGAGGALRASGVMYSAGTRVFRHQSSAFGSGDIFVSASAPSGGSDGDIWLQYA